MFMPKVTMTSIFDSTKLLRPLKEVQNTSEISISNQNRVKFSSRRKSPGVIHFSAVVKYSWADSASRLMSWALEALAVVALEEAGGAAQWKVPLLTRGHAHATLARAQSPDALAWLSALPIKDSFS